MARFYADEHFPAPCTIALRALGHDVLTAFEDGKANQKIPDDVVLEHATCLGRAVLTLNRWDFVGLHKRGALHAGIVACTEDKDRAALARRIDRAVAELVSLHGQLIRIVRPNLPGKRGEGQC